MWLILLHIILIIALVAIVFFVLKANPNLLNLNAENLIKKASDQLYNDLKANFTKR